MLKLITAQLVAIISLAAVTGASAQTPTPKGAPTGTTTAKPGETEVEVPDPELTDRPDVRLPRPAGVSAHQGTDGKIYVTWSRVRAAVTYQLIRSVPPDPAGAVSLPNPSDTAYADSDVKAGRSYYYVVSAVNQAGTVGLKAGSAPVKAVDMSPRVPPPPPADVKAQLNGTTAYITWKFIPGLRYEVHRAKVTNTGPQNWLLVTNDVRAGGFAYGVNDYTPGIRLIYRIIAEDSVGMQSQPSISNEISIPLVASADSANPADSTTPTDTSATRPPAATGTNVHPAIVAEPAKLKMGDPALKLGSSSTFTSLKLRRPHWISLNEQVATVDAQGQVKARAPGSTYIIANGIAPDGAVASMVARVEVVRARRK
jgi:hypothetical protein